MAADEAIDQLLTENNITEKQLKQRWRQVAMEHHPDRGGNPEKFIELRQAYETCLTKLKQPRRCDNCKGRGFVTISRGFFSCTSTCPACRGKRQ